MSHLVTSSTFSRIDLSRTSDIRSHPIQGRPACLSRNPSRGIARLSTIGILLTQNPESRLPRSQTQGHRAKGHERAARDLEIRRSRVSAWPLLSGSTWRDLHPCPCDLGATLPIQILESDPRGQGLVDGGGRGAQGDGCSDACRCVSAAGCASPLGGVRVPPRVPTGYVEIGASIPW